MIDEEIITVRKVKEYCKDMLEMAYDENFNYLGYGGICSIKYFKTEEEAVEYEFKTDELYENIKHLELDALVIERYIDDELAPYIPK